MNKIDFTENNENEIFSSAPSINLEESNFIINNNNSIFAESNSDNTSNFNYINSENIIDFLSFKNKQINYYKNSIQTPNSFKKNNDINSIQINSANKNKTNEIKDINIKTMERRKEKKDRIFRIYKINKNKGRIKKNSNYIGKHNKFCEDNIIRKIKGRFHEKCRIYINKEYKNYLLVNKCDAKKEKDLLQRIDPKFSRIIKKDENLKWLKSRLYHVYSENVSEKCSLYGPDHNKKEIEKIFKENKAKNVIDILNKPVKHMFEAFIKNIKIQGFKTLDNDINELKEKMIKDNQDNIEEYLSKYREVAQNLETIFIKKTPRNNK